MQQVKVDAVAPQARQAALAGLDHAAARGVVGIDLGDDEDAVVAALERFADDLLGTALAVHLGGVDQADAVVESGVDGRNLAPALARVLAHPPGAEAELRHRRAVGQGDGSHRRLLVAAARRMAAARPIVIPPAWAGAAAYWASSA
jgi:hypothetical protein